MTTLNPKQAAFCLEYVIDLNATQAAIRAGYSEKTANKIASENLTKPDIQQRIATLIQERTARTTINADYVLNRLVEIDQMDILDILDAEGNLKPITTWPQTWRRTLSGIDILTISHAHQPESILKKIKWPDKLKNLELLGKHINVQAFKEKRELDVTEGLPLPPTMDLSKLSDEQLQQLQDIADTVHRAD